MGSPIRRRDWWEHLSSTVDYPTGNGGRTTNAALALTRPGTRVILHGIFPLLGAAGPSVEIRHGDGVTPYFSGIFGATVDNYYQELDILLSDGLSMSGGGGGQWIVAFTLLR